MAQLDNPWVSKGDATLFVRDYPNGDRGVVRPVSALGDHGQRVERWRWTYVVNGVVVRRGSTEWSFNAHKWCDQINNDRTNERRA